MPQHVIHFPATDPATAPWASATNPVNKSTKDKGETEVLRKGETSCSERERWRRRVMRVKKRERRVTASEIEGRQREKGKTKQKNKTTGRQGYWADLEKLYELQDSNAVM